MMKQAWIATLVAVALAASASADSMEIRYWPTTFTPQKLVEIPVVMDVGLWIDINVQPKGIKLTQVDTRRFEGCTEVRVRCNFNATLLYSITPTGAVPGSYAVVPERENIDVPGGTTTLCARLVAPEFGAAGARNDLNVATITINVIPTP